MKKACILGAGSWGTALALNLSKNNYNVVLWTINEEQVDEINNNRTNHKYLPNIKISNNIKCTTNLEEAIKDSEFITIATPSQTVRNTLKKISKFTNSEQIIVDVAKGLEKDTGMKISEICAEELPQNPYTVLSGPSHAEEVANGIPTTLVVASTDIKVSKKIQEAFSNSELRVYISSDVIGVEIGGAFKNIIAFGAGICDGLNYGDNTKAALMTRGLTEIARLGEALGANKETFSGLSGIGDLIVTCTSVHSRNRKAGYLVGTGKNLEETLKEVEMVVEGITATEVAYNLSKKLNIEMPITEAIYSVLYLDSEPNEIVTELMNRNFKMEF